MFLVSRRRYNALKTQYQAALDAAAKARAECSAAVGDRQRMSHQLAAADAANKRLAERNAELTRRLQGLTGNPIEGGGIPRSASAELLQARAHARALEARLAELQELNMRCTCQGLLVGGGEA